jgi:hypothetical protein
MIRLQTWAVTSAASCPWHRVLSDLTSWAPLVVAAVTRSNRVIRDLEHWATCVTAAITHGRERLSGDDMDVLATPFRTLVPGLREELKAGG